MTTQNIEFKLSELNSDKKNVYDYSKFNDYRSNDILNQKHYGNICVCGTNAKCFIINPINANICSYCAIRKFVRYSDGEKVCIMQEKTYYDSTDNDEGYGVDRIIDEKYLYMFLTNYGRQILITNIKYEDYQFVDVNFVSLLYEYNFWIPTDYLNIIKNICNASNGIFEFKNTLQYIKDIASKSMENKYTYDYNKIPEKTNELSKKNFGNNCVCRGNASCLITFPIYAKICSYCAQKRFNSFSANEKICVSQKYTETTILITNYGKYIDFNNKFNIITVLYENNFWIPDIYLELINVIISDISIKFNVDNVLKYIKTNILGQK